MPHVVTRPGMLSPIRLAVLLAVVHGVNDALTAILGALLPTLQVRLDVGPATLAMLVAVFSISSSATQPTLGGLADRFGLRHFAAVGVGLAAVALSLVGPSTSTVLLVLLLAVGGIGSAALHPIASSIVAGPQTKNPGLAVGLFTAGGMTGFAAGPILVLALVATYGAPATVWLMIPGVLLAGLLWYVLPDYEPHAERGTATLFDRQALNARTVSLTLAMALAGVGFLTFTSAIPLWLVNNHNLAVDDPFLGWTLGAFSLSAALGAIAGGAIAPRTGPVLTAAGSLLLTSLGFAAVLLLPVGTTMLGAAALTGFLLYMSQPLLVVAAQQASPRAPTAAAGIVFGGGSGIAGLLYLGSGALQTSFGLTAAIIINAALLIPAAVIGAVALRSSGLRT